MKLWIEVLSVRGVNNKKDKMAFVIERFANDTIFGIISTSEYGNDTEIEVF